MFYYILSDITMTSMTIIFLAVIVTIIWTNGYQSFDIASKAMEDYRPVPDPLPCLQSCHNLKRSRCAGSNITQYLYLRICALGCRDKLWVCRERAQAGVCTYNISPSPHTDPVSPTITVYLLWRKTQISSSIVSNSPVISLRFVVLFFREKN